jgi:hypothetical protein
VCRVAEENSQAVAKIQNSLHATIIGMCTGTSEQAVITRVAMHLLESAAREAGARELSQGSRARVSSEAARVHCSRAPQELESSARRARDR